MRYFYLYPFNRQYFFPINAFEYPFLLSLYTPYSMKAKIAWWAFQHVSLLRRIFSVKETKLPNDLKNIRDIIESKKSLLAFNMGTPGVEQKTTVLGYEFENARKFFIKYAQNSVPKELVRNEYQVLKAIKSSWDKPEIISYKDTEEFVLLETTFLNGIKHQSTVIGKKLLDFIFDISNAVKKENDLKNNTVGNLRTDFAHGDLCPWNILICKDNIRAIDWEMGGVYPSGYDLFTFIFQTNFLLVPQKSPKVILENNIEVINKFFKQKGISKWVEYLIAFSSIKFEKESEKKSGLSEKYLELNELCKARF